MSATCYGHEYKTLVERCKRKRARSRIHILDLHMSYGFIITSTHHTYLYNNYYVINIIMYFYYHAMHVEILLIVLNEIKRKVIIDQRGYRVYKLALEYFSQSSSSFIPLTRLIWNFPLTNNDTQLQQPGT